MDKEALEAYHKAYYASHKEAHKEAHKIYNKAYRLLHKEELSVHRKEWYNSHKEDYYHYNKKNLVQRTKKAKEKRKNNIQYKLQCTLRHRLYEALKGNFKAGSAVHDLGCSISTLKIYLENQFQEGMSWKNHSIHGWHIDHIKPLCEFDLTVREQLLQACHYTNLQPLWAKDNLKKWGHKNTPT